MLKYKSHIKSLHLINSELYNPNVYETHIVNNKMAFHFLFKIAWGGVVNSLTRAYASDLEQCSNIVHWDNFTFVQLFLWIVANIDQIWLSGGWVNGSKTCSIPTFNVN